MKKKHTVLKIILGAFALAIRYGGFRIWKMYSDHEKYMGHGFDYMHGYSTTDFTGYHVYDGQKLVTLDHRASLVIENEEDMPVLMGLKPVIRFTAPWQRLSIRTSAALKVSIMMKRKRPGVQKTESRV